MRPFGWRPTGPANVAEFLVDYCGPIIAAASLAVAALFIAVVVRSTRLLPADTESSPSSGTAFLVELSGTTIARWINGSESLFAYPGMLFFHTFGLAMAVGISIAVDLRLLGFATRIPLASMRPLFRYLWLGFWMSAVSGAMLFAADAPRKAQNPLFEIKLALVALGVMVTALVYRHNITCLDEYDTQRHRDTEEISQRSSVPLCLGVS